MPSKASQFVLVQHGGGFLNGLVPDFARMLDDQLSASSALGSVPSERSYRGDVLRFNQGRGDRPIDKALIEKYLKYLSRQDYSPSYNHPYPGLLPLERQPHPRPAAGTATLRSLLPPEEHKTISETAECCLMAKVPRCTAPSALNPEDMSRSPSSTSLMTLFLVWV